MRCTAARKPGRNAVSVISQVTLTLDIPVLDNTIPFKMALDSWGHHNSHGHPLGQVFFSDDVPLLMALLSKQALTVRKEHLERHILGAGCLAEGLNQFVVAADTRSACG